MYIIILSGPDGSGKTTLSHSLKMYFLLKSFSTGYHWLGGTHLLASLLARYLPRFEILRGSDNPYYNLRIPSKLRIFWLFLEFTSFLPIYLFRRLLSIFYDFLICDRGLLDFIIWIISTTRYPSFLKTLYGKFLLRLLSKESIIYIYASPEILILRADVPRGFLIREYTVYEILKKYSKVAYSLDTSYDSPITSLAKLISYLRREYGFN